MTVAHIKTPVRAVRTEMITKRDMLAAGGPERAVADIRKALEGAGFDMTKPFESDYDWDKMAYVYLQEEWIWLSE